MDACSDCMAYEFQPENVSPFYEDYRLFVRPQWPFVSQLTFVCYRVIVAVLICVWVGIDFFDEAAKFYSDNYAVWFIFATNWGFLILAVSAVCRAVAATMYYLQGKVTDDDDVEAKRNSVAMMVLWILYNIAANGAMVVTISYWTFLTAFDSSGFLNTHMSEIKHTLNTAYVISDLFLSAMPIRIFHLIYPMFVGAIYTVFNALYFINDGMGPGGKPYAYYVMDWRNPIESAVTCSLGFVLTSVVQSFLYAIYRLRVFIYKRCFSTSGHEDAMILEGGDASRSGEEHSQNEEQCLNGLQEGKKGGGREEESILRLPTTYHAVDSGDVIEMIDETPNGS